MTSSRPDDARMRLRLAARQYDERLLDAELRRTEEKLRAADKAVDEARTTVSSIRRRLGGKR